MTKSEILSMKKSIDIMKALANHPELWGAETSNHLKTVSMKEHKEKYGGENVIVTPLTKK